MIDSTNKNNWKKVKNGIKNDETAGEIGNCEFPNAQEYIKMYRYYEEIKSNAEQYEETNDEKFKNEALKLFKEFSDLCKGRFKYYSIVALSMLNDVDRILTESNVQ